MSCVKPLKAYWRSRSRDAITFDVNKSLNKLSFALPCGRCIGCRLQKAQQWALRCLHEKRMWRHNWFVTLTYSDDFLPDGGTLVLRDLQLFMKRLRKARRATKENPIRFFAAGEYGDQNYRPHYHLLLFNCPFKDMRFHTTNDRGEYLYTSRELSELWFQGFSTIGELTFDSAIYCAKYALKKLSVSEFSPQEVVDRYNERYLVYDADGVVVADRVPEFAVMSRRPGIGSAYYDKYGHEVRAHDNVIVDGRPVRPPRFYDSRTELVDPVRFEELKRKRKSESVKDVVKADNTPERLRVKGQLLQIASDKKERKL